MSRRPLQPLESDQGGPKRPRLDAAKVEDADAREAQLDTPPDPPLPATDDGSDGGAAAAANSTSGPVIPVTDRILELRVEGDAAFKEQLHDHAVECYGLALKLAGPWTERSLRASLSCNRATAFLALKDFEKAKEDAQDALKLEPSWAKAHYCLGMAMHELHNVEASNKCFAQVVRLKPGIRIKLPTGAWFGAGADEYVPTQDFVTPSVAVQSTAPLLPAGWVARESRQYPGRFFFVETKTGKSTWDQPKISKPLFAKPIPSTRGFF